MSYGILLGSFVGIGLIGNVIAHFVKSKRNLIIITLLMFCLSMVSIAVFAILGG